MRLLNFVSNNLNGPIDIRYGTLPDVELNRNKIFSNLDLDQNNLIKLNVQNKSEVLFLINENRDEWQKHMGVWQRGNGLKCDAIITNIKNLILECNPGDCGIYTLFHNNYNLMAMVHSGRQGSIEKILKKTIEKMAKYVKVDIKDFTKQLCVDMSPAIKGKNYIIDYLILDRFEITNWMDFLGCESLDLIDYPNSSKVKLVFSEVNKKIKFDFIGFNKKLLLNLGVDETNIKISEICTYEHKDFPSYYKYLKGLDNDGRFMVLSSMIDK
ncbi:polyphenol oxidase family protein [Candidatus Woesearchaeota archaeon]|mgnify:CR=1 FL=1|jgi:copper oxidase (laccase) domain-containing protein|nr:polyphenol oxidase family protein [Candidatus Woesearchaeota archaeon]MBT4387037.1 polyphenol oxidase family protein [Candidatus Woesearchaeota archaeon]MBT4595913.1 polyphenol oxidase family protein [Candidatus Woesearchaeota archaeon]MBT5741043.1 polyphenol oxidase family protein [Candidatus Woesearchaeota archaeon]MBT6505284.1 polyphenol oxidase family protein [Candidatus Woesearchaeota archaeon]